METKCVNWTYRRLKETYYPRGDFNEIVDKGNKFFADWKRFRDTNLIQSDQYTKDLFEKWRGFYLGYLKHKGPVPVKTYEWVDGKLKGDF